MTATRIEAKEEIKGLANEAIRAVHYEHRGVPADGNIFWETLEEPEVPSAGYWFIVTVRTVAQPRRGVGVIQVNDATAARYENIGKLCIQACGSRSETDAAGVIDEMAEDLKGYFNELRTALGVVFERVEVKDHFPPDEYGYQVQMWADWRVDEIRQVAT